MFTVLVVMAFVVLGGLSFVSAIRPQHETLQADLISIQRIVSAILLVAEVALLVGAFGWLLGLVGSVLVVLFYGTLSRMSWLEHLAENTYKRYEAGIVKFIETHPRLFSVLRVMPRSSAQQHLSSREELERMVKESTGILTVDEKTLIVHSLTFADRLVKTVMTPRSMIKTIEKGEFLGPLVLDELHGFGHSRLPVIDKDIDHVVGVLHLNDLLSLDNKRSATAEEAMDGKVFYIHEDDSLSHTLAAFLRSRRHLFIVVNEFRETVGLVTLEDVIEALLGKKIVDEGDNHDDLRAVAARNPNRNNQPSGHVDV